MADLDCEIVTPEGQVFSGRAEMVVVPGVEGELGVFARHAPTVARLRAGEVRVRTEGPVWYAFATDQGYFKVQRDRALVLVQSAVPVDEIDVEQARALADDARARIGLADSGDDSVDRHRAERDLAFAENLLEIAGR
jgi:F-type H+-transporting ATPase subunit epsilon